MFKLSVAMLLMLSTVPAFALNSQEGISEFYATKLSDGQVAFMWLGEGRGELTGVPSAGVLVRTSEHAIVIDPSNILAPDDTDTLESLDLILITHEHGDHFDPDSTVNIHEKTGAPVAASAGALPDLEGRIAGTKLVEMLPGDLETINGITVRAIPAEHPADRPVMYLIEMDGVRIFHGSDSGFVDELNNIEAGVHLAFVPAGMPSPTASPEDAASMVRALAPYVTVPVHGIFEQMQALKEMVDNETVVVMPGAFVVNVPAQIIPEFPLAVLVLIATMVMALAVMTRVRPLPLCSD